MKTRNFLVLAVGLLLAACQSAPESWTGAEVEERRAQAEWALIDHHVMFPSGSATLTADEKERLVGFLMRQAVDERDTLFVTAFADSPNSVESGRRAAIDRVLRFYHLESQDAPVDQLSDAGAGEHVTLTVGRYVAVLPDCPDWRKPPGYDFHNTTSSNYRCATETNLGLMVADPRDLIIGRDPGRAEGTTLARGVERYRRGATPNVRAESTQ